MAICGLHRALALAVPFAWNFFSPPGIHMPGILTPFTSLFKHHFLKDLLLLFLTLLYFSSNPSYS